MTARRVLFAWELGGNYGHLVPVLRIGQVLQARGCEVIAIVRDLTRASPLERAGIRVIQAPLWGRPVPAAPKLPRSYAEILMHFGYLDAEGLGVVVSAWRELYDMVRPDLLICDHAPTALMAARGRGMRTAVFGFGFIVPPALTPIPPLRVSGSASRTADDSEARVVAVANRVLASSGGNKLASLSALFDVDARVLCTYPELDQYGARDGERYWGAPFALPSAGTAAPAFRSERPRFVAYVRSSAPGFRALIQSLKRHDCEATVIAADLDEAAARQLCDARVSVRSTLADLSTLLPGAAGAITHGGHGTTTGCLHSGVPLILIPQTLEEQLTAARVVAMGAGVAYRRVNDATDFGEGLRRLLGNDRYRKRARDFAEKYRDFDSPKQLDAIADHIVGVSGPVVRH